ncbi:MAG: acyltransferase family protein [Candidatus Kryptoniota bacterium]
METRNRLVLLDLLRAIGVLLMVEGHTVDAVLSPVYKDGSNFVFQFWTFFRGLTAPFFFFTSGFAFVIASVKENNGMTMVTKRTRLRRVRRILTLLLLGYGLHFPLHLLYDISSVSGAEWRIFLLVDALHIISLSLLIILLTAVFVKRLKTLQKTYIAFAFLALILAPITEPVQWERLLPGFLYPYMTFRAGSFFTFFPFSGYLFSGAAFGVTALLAPKELRTFVVSKSLLWTSLISIAAFCLFFPIQIIYVSPYVDYWRALPAVNLLRFGIVTLVGAFIGYSTRRVQRLPKILPAIGKHSLAVYVVHLMIVYGSPFNIGLAQLIAGGVNPWLAAAAAVIMISLMIGMIYAIEAYRSRRKAFEAVVVREIAK